MAYEIEWWESDRPHKPENGGEARIGVVRVANLPSAHITLAGIIATLPSRAVRVTLSDTRGRVWDLVRLPKRDISLDTDTRDLSDQRPAGAAVARAKRRGG